MHIRCTYYTTIAGDQVHSISPITPSELLIALHNIDCQEDEALMKAVIKGGGACVPFSLPAITYETHQKFQSVRFCISPLPFSH